MKLELNIPKIYWTQHSKNKMRYYRLTQGRVKRVLRNPKRKEEGIAPRTIAVMQPAGTKKNPSEIWVMYQRVKLGKKKQGAKLTKIISAWRYPGKSPVGKQIYVPEDTLEELERISRARNQV